MVSLMSGAPNDPGTMRLAGLWTARMTTVLGELLVPPALGAWFDQHNGTSWGALLGLAIGVPFAMWHLIKMVQRDDSYKPAATPSDAESADRRDRPGQGGTPGDR